MEDLTMLELFVLDSINEYSEKIITYLMRPKLPQHEMRIMNKYIAYVNTYREILHFIRKFREKKNNGAYTSKDNIEEAQ